MAVVLFNLGGPKDQAAVYDFLHALFSDPAILRVPGVVRKFLAWLIARRRTPKAQEIYRHLGGGSPILQNTEKQGKALETALNSIDYQNQGVTYKTFIAMRYAPPRAADIMKELERYSPDCLVLLPLYPQFSTTTSDSSLKEFRKLLEKNQALGEKETKTICCFPTQGGFIEAQAQKMLDVLNKVGKETPLRILYSAHGLPVKIVEAGDPYPAQLEKTVERLNEKIERAGFSKAETVLCYQSKVGPIAWLTPSTEAEIKRAGADQRPVLVVPLSFVSEHSETLVELDIDYKKLAQEYKLPGYWRVPTVMDSPAFIEGLAQEVLSLVKAEHSVANGASQAFCQGKAQNYCPYWEICKIKEGAPEGVLVS